MLIFYILFLFLKFALTKCHFVVEGSTDDRNSTSNQDMQDQGSLKLDSFIVHQDVEKTKEKTEFQGKTFIIKPSETKSKYYCIINLCCYSQL